MTLMELYGLDTFVVVSEPENWERETAHCHIGDLISHIISRAKRDDIWITSTGSINVAAAAKLCGMACVIISDGIQPDDDMISAAKEHKVCVFTSSKSAFELAGIIYCAAGGVH